MFTKPGALVLGVEHPRDAATIRSLHRAGVKVDIADDKQPPTAMWLASRCIRTRYLLPKADEKAVVMLESLGLPENTVLIPTNDQYLILASRYHERLSPHYRVATPPWNILCPLMDKIQCHEIGRRAGIATPHHYYPESVEELDNLLEELDFRNRAHILKIRMWDSGAADPASLRRVVKGGEDAEALRAGCLEIFSRNGVMPVIEEVIPGGADRCIGVSMVVDKSHEPVLAYCVQRLKLHTYARGFFRHPYELGANAYCHSVHDEEAIELATAFVREAKYSGAITVEFKRDAIDEQLKLIKGDVRVVRATRLSTALGLDIPQALYETYTSDRPPMRRQRQYKEGIGWIWFEAYMYSLWKNRKDASLVREMLLFFKRLMGVRAFAYFDLRDPVPSILLFFTAMKRLKRLETRGLTKETRPVSG
jgi:predicted ATP-grasp superfamily ATP-dependent carboligase